MPGIFKDEEDSDLVGHLPPGREGHGCTKTAVLSERVEEPDLGEFDGEM